MMLWYTARGAGLAALVLLSLSTCLGALVSRQPAEARATLAGGRYLVQYLHRTLAGLGLVVLFVHVGTIVADSYAHVRLTGAIIPFASGYRSGWVALGTIAAYLLVGVAIHGLARGRLASSARGARTWRGVHLLAYAGWVAAVVHGLDAGSDIGVGWVRLIFIACVTAVVASVTVRLGGVLQRAPSATAKPAARPVPSRIGVPR